MHSLKDLVLVFFRFFGAYGIMLYFYNGYLEQESKKSFIDEITKNLSNQIVEILNKIGFPSRLINAEAKNAYAIYINEAGRIVCYINEGCNAVSLMIIFLAFCIAFYSDFFKTIGFMLFGLVVIYLSNVFRIVLLALIYLKYNNQATFAHDIIFPIIIYGTILILWFYWINSIVLKKILK